MRSVPKPDLVSIGYIHGNEVTHSWHQSMLNLIQWDMGHDQHVLSAGWYATRYGTGGIVQARNDTVIQFLKGPGEWLFWIDTDMGFAPDTVDRLLASADKKERPVVGALCFAMREVAVDGMGGFIVQPAPTVFDWIELEDGRQGFHTRLEYEKDQLLQVAGTGSAAILIHRSVFEKIQEEHGNTWYSPVFNKSMNLHVSEDLSFCSRVGAMNIPVHIDTGVKTSHLKQLWLDERIYDRLQVVGMGEKI